MQSQTVRTNWCVRSVSLAKGALTHAHSMLHNSNWPVGRLVPDS